MAFITVEGIQIETLEIDVAFKKVRARVDDSGYGSFVSDELCRALATDVVVAIETNRSKKPS